MPINKPYASNRRRLPSKKVERRIRMPESPLRPLKFQARSLLKTEFIRPQAWWMSVHRRGPKQTVLGESDLEKRAAPKSLIKGTLPERILYKALIELLHFVPGVDFKFQSSQQGGRMELGGIVADFIFPLMKIVIQVQGPTHAGFLRSRKDEEQALALAEMGYIVVEIQEELIYNIYRFENWLRALFTSTHFGEPGGNPGVSKKTGVPGLRSDFYDTWIWDTIIRKSIFIGDSLHEFGR
jgi:very-short-patch-repair endonuclease